MGVNVYCFFSTSYDKRNQKFFSKERSFFIENHTFVFLSLQEFFQRVAYETNIVLNEKSIFLFCPSVQDLANEKVFFAELKKASDKCKDIPCFLMPPFAFLEHIREKEYFQSCWKCQHFVEKEKNFSFLPNYDLFLNDESQYKVFLEKLWVRLLRLYEGAVLPQVQYIERRGETLWLHLNTDLCLSEEKIFGFRLAEHQANFSTAYVERPKTLSYSPKVRILQLMHPYMQNPCYVAYGMGHFYGKALYSEQGIPLLPFTNYSGVKEVGIEQIFESCNMLHLPVMLDPYSQTLHGTWLSREVFKILPNIQASLWEDQGKKQGISFVYFPHFKANHKSSTLLLQFQLQAALPPISFPGGSKYLYIKYRSFGTNKKKIYFTVPMQYENEKDKGEAFELVGGGKESYLLLPISKEHRQSKAFAFWLEEEKEDLFAMKNEEREQFILLEMGLYG